MPTTEKYDVIIIGSGISGSLTALQLAKAKFKVLILEAGDTKSDRLKSIHLTVRRTRYPFRKKIKYYQ